MLGPRRNAVAQHEARYAATVAQCEDLQLQLAARTNRVETLQSEVAAMESSLIELKEQHPARLDAYAAKTEQEKNNLSDAKLMRETRKAKQEVELKNLRMRSTKAQDWQSSSRRLKDALAV